MEPVFEILYYGLALKTTGIALGVALIAAHIVALLKADTIKAWLPSFPRNKRTGVIILAVDLVWSWIVIKHMDMGEFYTLRKPLLIGLPIAFYLIITFADEFLSVRALGTFLLLLSCPVLNAAFLKDPWPAVTVALALVAVVSLAALFTVLFNRDTPPPQSPQPTPVASPQLPSLPAAAENMPERLAAARSTLRQFAFAAKPDDIIPLVRDGTRLRSAIRAYYDDPRHRLESRELEIKGTARPLLLGNQRFLVMAVPWGETKTPREFVLEEPADGSAPLVDWQALVGHNPMPLSHYAPDSSTLPPAGPTPLRVIATLASPPAGDPLPGALWLTLVHPDEPGTSIAAYLRPENQHRPLVLKLLQSGPAKLMLTLQPPTPADSPLIHPQITNLASGTWFLLSPQ